MSSRRFSWVVALIFCALSTEFAASADETSSLLPKSLLPAIETPSDIGRLTIDPQEEFVAENALMTPIPELFNGLNINNFLGADRFYNAGISGQGTSVANIEGGHIWSGHVTLAHVSNFTTASGGLGEVDRHATGVGMAIGGRKYAVNPRDHQTGIAPNTDLRSGAFATGWEASSPTPRYSTRFFTTSSALFSVFQPTFGAVDAINSSWGYYHGGSLDPSGSEAISIGLDGLARANPRTTFVTVAHNNGPAPNSITWPGADYNSITVGNLGNPNTFDTPHETSGRGPQDYSDPVHGLIPAARAAVDLAAPGTSITSAYYGGETGGNSPSLGGSPSGSAGSPTSYANFTGTSFAAPIVAGGVALLDSASYNTPTLAANPNSRDARVIKAVLLNSATKTSGWNNGLAAVGGVLTTHQALDYAVGAGRMNLNSAYDQYLSGTTDAPGSGGGVVSRIGWDFASVAPLTTNDYVITSLLAGGTTFNATLSWFRDRTFTNSSTASDNAFRDLDLEVWDSTFANLIAQSDSTYENVEHLSFSLPFTGSYGLRVRYTQTIFGAPAGESYGISWAGVAAIPEPAMLALLILAMCAGLRPGRSPIAVNSA